MEENYPEPEKKEDFLQDYEEKCNNVQNDMEEDYPEPEKKEDFLQDYEEKCNNVQNYMEEDYPEPEKNEDFLQDYEEKCNNVQNDAQNDIQNDVKETKENPELNKKDNSFDTKQKTKQEESMINKKRKREKKNKKKSPQNDQENQVDNNKKTDDLNNENENSKDKNKFFKFLAQYDKFTLLILEIQVSLYKGNNNKNDKSNSYEKVAKYFISLQNNIINKFLKSKKDESKNLEEKNNEFEKLIDTIKIQGKEKKLNKSYNDLILVFDKANKAFDDMNKKFEEYIDKINYNIDRKDNKRIEIYFKPISSLFEYLNENLKLDFDFNFHKLFINNYGSSVKRMEELNNLYIYQLLDIFYEKKGEEKEKEKAYKLIKSMKESKELYDGNKDSKIYKLCFFLTRKCKEIFDYYYENKNNDKNKYLPIINNKSFIDYFNEQNPKENIFENLIKNVKKRNGENNKNSKKNKKNEKNEKKSNIELKPKEIPIFTKMRNHFDQNKNNNDVVIHFIAPNDNKNSQFRNSTKKKEESQNSNENKSKINNINSQLKITDDTSNLKDINNNLSENNNFIYNINKYFLCSPSMDMNYKNQTDNNPGMNNLLDDRDLDSNNNNFSLHSESFLFDL